MIEEHDQQHDQQHSEEPAASMQAALAIYQAMAEISAAMLAAAQAEDWDLLVRLEAGNSAHAATLQQAAATPTAPPDQASPLIERMLADGAQIRTLATARMTQLSQQLHSAQMQRKLARAYEA